MVDYEDLGNRITRERHKLKMSQEALGEKAGISVQHISNIENAKTKVSLDALVRIVNALNLTLDKILGNSLEDAKVVFESELSKELVDCSTREIRFLIDVLRAAKKNLRTKDLD